MRSLILTLVAVLVLGSTAAARDADDVRVTRVGELILLKFPGNRQAGYRWRLNKKLSRGLDRVRVRDVGWTISQQNKSMFFKNSGVMSISVRGTTPGPADLAFDYFRSWGNRNLIRTRYVRVMVQPANKPAQTN